MSGAFYRLAGNSWSTFGEKLDAALEKQARAVLCFVARESRGCSFLGRGRVLHSPISDRLQRFF